MSTIQKQSDVIVFQFRIVLKLMSKIRGEISRVNTRLFDFFGQSCSSLKCCEKRPA
jgi:hypothetical protein